jgi:hypothetical protein
MPRKSLIFMSAIAHGAYIDAWSSIALPQQVQLVGRIHHHQNPLAAKRVATGEKTG